MQPLAHLPVDETARLLRIDGDGGYRRRLLELGFLPGATIRVVRRVDIGGLIELEVRGARVTLRTTEAHAILVDAS